MNTVIKKLPFFPTPYPDECFYSILCRYHVRSGHPTSMSTIKRLFGKNYVVASSLHTAFRAEYLEQWIPHSKKISPERIVYEHSSYQYSLLCSIESASRFPSRWQKRELKEYLDIPYTKLYGYGPRVGKRHGAVCYCPACAEEECRVYGEPYWHVLHQMAGVEFCPVHGVPILITGLGYGRRRLTFIPASEIKRAGLTGNPSQEARDSTAADCEAFMQLAGNIAWLLKNGIRFNKDISITQALAQGKNYNDTRYLSQALFLGQLAENALAQTSAAFRKIIAGNLEPGRFIDLHMRSTSHAVVFAYLMGIMYGSAEQYFQSTCAHTNISTQ
ncbi:MAG: TniQ family protein [Lachnospiraceae bacterium]|nr:TniQ family protein [Lachnospiraceae bacterium]